MTVTTDTLIAQQIDQATEAARKLQQWLDAAGQWQQALAQQKQLQDQLAQAQQRLAALEAMYQTAPPPAPTVSLDEALAEMEGGRAAGVLFAGVMTMQDESESTPADAAADLPISSAAENLAELFALPLEPKPAKPEPEEESELDTLLDKADDSWMQNLDDIGRIDDQTSDDDLELLFKDIEESPDSPWADPWDTALEPIIDSGDTATDLLPIPEWEAEGNTPPAIAAPEKKKRGLFSKFFR